MQKNREKNILLSSLQKLYEKLATLLVQIRSSSYRSFSRKHDSFDITSVLNKQVDDLATRAAKEDSISHNTDILAPQPDFTQVKTENKNVSDNNIENVSGIESEFTKHLKQRKSSSVTQPHMRDKLTASAWEHIHSAIRYARKGDVDAAKLHVDISGHALEEAGHYMNDEEYSDLVFQIEHYFTEAQKK